MAAEEYSLQIRFDTGGMNYIYATSQCVTIVKNVVSQPSAPSDLPIAWLAFQPWETNQLCWVEDYSIYATPTVLLSGTKIVMSSQVSSVQRGWTYTFENGLFAPSPGTGGTFNVSDQVDDLFSFGLSQSVMVNGTLTTAPLNAVPVPFNESVSFTPQETISIFLSIYENNGSVIDQVTGNALTLSLSSESPKAIILFNDDTQTFYQVPGNAASQCGVASL